MMNSSKCWRLFLVSLSVTGVGSLLITPEWLNFLGLDPVSFSSQTLAQPIQPEPNSTNTVTTQTGNRVDITGGRQSGDGSNLFHSFTEFNLNSGQIANFVSSNSIQNIIARVVGGNGSIINGVLEVTGSSANLFLLNPAGILFGADASLNVPASFTATTATGIGFNSGWFNAIGTNDYAAIAGQPNAFLFSSLPANLVNSGQLAVKAGQNLTLLGGTVINTGELSAPSGQITIAAVPGENLIRLSQTGHLLSLELEPQTGTLLADGDALQPLSLPQLLTGENTTSATGIAVLPDGSVQLTATGVTIPTTGGVAVISGTVDTASSSTVFQSQTNHSQINIVGSQIGLFDAQLDASTPNGDGRIQIGGNLFGEGSLPTALQTFIDPNSTLKADALVNGNGGQIRIAGSNRIEVLGSISAQGKSSNSNTVGEGGLVEVSGTGKLLFDGTVNLQGSNNNNGTLILVQENIFIADQQTRMNFDGVNPFDVTRPIPFTLSETTLEDLGQTANVILEAKNNITISQLSDNALRFPGTTGSTLTLTADADRSGTGSFIMNSQDRIQTSGSNLIITGVNVETGNLMTEGGDIRLSAMENGNLRTGNLSTSHPQSGGDISLSSENNLKTGSLLTQATQSQNGVGGDITAIARNDIETQQINTTGNAQAGDIRLTSSEGDITVASNFYSIDATSGQGTGGNVFLESSRQLRTDLIDTRGREAGGNIRLEGDAKLTASGIRTGTYQQQENSTGNIELISDEINLIGGANSVRGSGTLVLQPATPSQPIALGGIRESVTETLDLTTTDLGTLKDGFANIFVGRIDSQGTIFVMGNTTFEDPVTLRSPFGDIQGSDRYTLSALGDARLTLEAMGDITLGRVSTQQSDLSIFSQTGRIRLNGLSGGTGNVYLSANEIDLIGGQNSIQGTGSLTLQPSAANQSITLGHESETAALDLSLGDLTALADGFRTLIIGQADGNSSLTVAGDVTFRDPTQLLASGTGTIGGTGRITGVGNASVALSATGDIRVGEIRTEGQNISITSSDGQIATGQLQSASTQNSRGDIRVTAEGNITTGSIRSTATGQENSASNSGRISLISQTGSLQIEGDIFSTSQGGTTGGVNLTAQGDITTKNILANEEITLTSTEGRITTGQLQISDRDGQGLLSNTATPGGIILNAKGNIFTDDLITSPSLGVAHPISLTSERGSIQSGDITTSGTQGGGTIALQAGDRIFAGDLNASSGAGEGGSVWLMSPQDIEVSSINTEGGTIGGDIQVITDQFFRATGTFTATGGITASLSSKGGEKGGFIQIQRRQVDCITNPACASPAFTIGNATTHGTAGTITNGNSLTVTPPSRTDKSNPNPTPPTDDVQVPPTPSNPDLDPSESPSNVSNSPTPPSTSEPILETSTDNIATTDPSETLDASEPTEPSEPLTVSEEQAVQVQAATIANDQVSSSPVISSFSQIDLFRGQEFANYFGTDLKNSPVTDQSIRQTLRHISVMTGYKPAIVYVSIQPTQLELRLILPDGKPVFKSIAIEREELLQTVRDFSNQIRSPRNFEDKGYKITGKQLYTWLIAPIQELLNAEEIDTLIFSMDTGLRTLPLAALYDGKNFLLERYSLGLIPSLSLTDTSYVNIKNSKVLAMGASNFVDPAQQSLPAVPVELNLIVEQNLWPGQTLLNEQFTIDNLRTQRSQHQFEILHLATHGEFLAGGAAQSYIQFWDTKLRLNELRTLRLHQPPVELLVLSACTTAVGDEEAELGFAGLAVQAGVKSALASLWYVSDAGTLGLMRTFYEALLESPIKAEALRQAQLAMLHGQVRLQNGQLVHHNGQKLEKIKLPPEITTPGNLDLSHPYYWAGFTLIGSPW